MGRSRARSHGVVALLSAIVASAVTLTISSGAAGATMVSDEASFRAAWTDPDEKTIELDTDIVLTCAKGGVAVRDSTTALTLTGNAHTIRQSCPANGVLRQDGTGPVTLQSVTVSGGATPDDGGGLAAAGDVTILDSTVKSNTAGGRGGGVWTAKSATVTGSSLTGNQAGLTTIDGYGGALLAEDHLTLTDSVVTGNTADGSGGASGNNGSTIVRSTISDNVGPVGAGGTGSFGSITVEDSTISGNSASESGAGGVGAVGPITLINSTVVDNHAGDIGGGGVFSDSSVTLIYATVVANSATAGAANVVGFPIKTFGSVVALPVDGRPNCQGPTSSQGYNFSDDDACDFASSTDRRSAGDPELGELAANGGPTMTRAPLSKSPLVASIPADECQADGAAGVTTDQRGAPRPQGSDCEIGAVETAGTGPTVPIASPPTPVLALPRFTG